MKAHFVPVSYLKAFAETPSLGRNAVVQLVERKRKIIRRVKQVCVCKDYYTSFPQTDSKLFESQEKILGELAQANEISADLAQHLWQLKIRNQAILDFSKYRELILQSTVLTSLGSRETVFIESDDVTEFITCDDPLIVYAGNRPEEMCFILTVSPKRLIVSAPIDYYSITKSTSTADDVHLINRQICRQVRKYAIMRPYQSDVSSFQEYFPNTPFPARSEITFNTPQFIILNFLSHNPRGPEGLPSFLSLR